MSKSHRFMCVISDGQNSARSMLTDYLHPLAENNFLCVNSIVRVKSYVTTPVGEQGTVVILSEIDILQENPGRKYGNPIKVEKDPIFTKEEEEGKVRDKQTEIKGEKKVGDEQRRMEGEGKFGEVQREIEGGEDVKGERKREEDQREIEQERKEDNGGGEKEGRAEKGGLTIVAQPNLSSLLGDSVSSRSRRRQQQGYNNDNDNNNSSNTNNHNNNNNNTFRGGGEPTLNQFNSNSSAPITPISSLSIYQKHWTIRACVKHKKDVRHWKNGEGTVFSTELVDSFRTDIRAAFFNDAATKFYPMLQEGKIYTFSGGEVKYADKRFNTCTSNFEIIFGQDAKIHEGDDAGGEFPQHLFRFKKIAELESVEPGSFVDVLGVVTSVGQVVNLTSKKGEDLTKCELTLLDDSLVDVILTIWGDKASSAKLDLTGSPAVVSIRRAKLREFRGTVSLSGGTITINPMISEAEQLRSWWEENLDIQHSLLD